MDIFSHKFILRAKIITITIVSIIVSYILFANIILHFYKKEATWKKIFSLAPAVQFGLDIVGGSQLLIAVDFDRFLDEKYSGIFDEIKQTLWNRKAGYNKIFFDKIEKEIVIELTQKSNIDFDKIAQSIDYNLKVKKSDNAIKIKYDNNSLESLRSKITEQSMLIIQRRIDSSGTKEIVMYRHGKDKIILQVPGVNNPEQLKRLLGKTAKLSFHLMDSREPFLNHMPSYVEEDMEVLQSSENSNRFYKIIKKAALSGDTLTDARYSSENMKIAIIFKLNNQGTTRFRQITSENIGKPFAIVLDNKVLTAPIINEPIIGGNGMISGHFSAQEAEELAGLLKSGALPAHLNVVEERVIGPSIGKTAIESAKVACGMGIGLLMLFMIFYYKVLGLVANIAIILNLACAVAVMAIFKFSITLPGIAGLILTLGMSIDANVLIYERMRDELQRKKIDIMTVITQGFEGSFSAIIDSNITTILSAVTLVAIGSGFIRGFAISLIVGLLTSLFTAIVLTKVIIEALAKSGKLNLYLKS